MPNIIDYLKYMKNKTFQDSKINEVDSIILTRLSYMPFSDINFEGQAIIQDVAKKFEELLPENFFWPDDSEFIKELSKTERYKNITISDYYEKFDIPTETQFAAITIWLPDNEKYISFRGTDATIIGWKEDFNMSFMTHVPSQIEGVKYVEKIAKKYDSNIRIGGHSKGGNVAVYSAIFCDDNIKDRIIEITNADGPGFDDSVISNEEYKKIVNRTNTYIPQSSIIGRVLEHKEKYQIVKSIQKGIMQHDIYSWEIEGTKLVHISEITNGSQIVNNIVSDWLRTTTPEQRENFVSSIYEIIKITDARTTLELKASIPKNIKKVLEKYKHLDKQEKKTIENMIKMFLVSIKTTLGDGHWGKVFLNAPKIGFTINDYEKTGKEEKEIN